MATSAQPDEEPKRFWRPDSDINDDTLPPASRAVFEQWSGIAPADVLPHIKRCRAAAYAIHPYPCIGELRFLQFSIGRQPSYARLVERLKAAAPEHGDDDDGDADADSLPPALLDIGCCVGQDLRRLAHDGVPSERLYGAELLGDFVELGYDLFRDRGKLGATFVVGDALQEGGAYDTLKARFDVVHAASFLHLFSWHEQVKLAARMVGLLKPKAGVTVLGRQVGKLSPGEYPSYKNQKSIRYLHDPQSFQRMWDEIGEQTGTEWKSHATMEEIPLRLRDTFDSHDSGTRLIVFEVTRTK